MLLPALATARRALRYNGDFNDEGNIDSIDYNIWLEGTLGDFDFNGVVDAADYVVWRKCLGGVFTQHGYDVWREIYGRALNGSGSASLWSSTAVPEPSAFFFLLATFFVVALRRPQH